MTRFLSFRSGLVFAARDGGLWHAANTGRSKDAAAETHEFGP